MTHLLIEAYENASKNVINSLEKFINNEEDFSNTYTVFSGVRDVLNDTTTKLSFAYKKKIKTLRWDMTIDFDENSPKNNVRIID